MASKSAAVEKIQKIITDEDIIELAGRGLQPTQIARQLEVSIMAVQTCLDRWLGETSIRLAEKAEQVRLVELARLDYIYSHLSNYAFGHYDEILQMDVPPDKGLLELMIKVIKEKREWDRVMRDARNKDKDAPITNIEHIEITISQTNPLYHIALEGVNQQRWANYADMDVSELYTPPEQIEAPKLDLEDQINEVAPYIANFEEILAQKEEVDD